MAIFVFVLDDCKKDAVEHGCQAALDRFALSLVSITTR